MHRYWLAAMFAAGLVHGQVSERARKLQHDALVFDAHVHMIDRQFYLGGDIGDRLPNGQVDLPRAKEGGVKAMFFSIFVPEAYYPGRYETKQAFRLMDLALDQIEKNHDKIEMALTATDIERIVRKGKIAAVMDLEGGFDLDGDLHILHALYRLGLRSAQLSAHNWTNNFADSCCSPPKWHGLNERGRAVVREMNRLGMVINVSHSSDETIEQTLEISTDPIVATHHGMRSIVNIPRNMPDELMKKIAAKGGVIGFQIGNDFHNPKVFEWTKKQAGKPFYDTSGIGEREAKMSIGQIDKLEAPMFPMVGKKVPDDLLFTPDGWVAVVDRAIRLIGEDHVALGTDFDGGPTLPRGMRDIRDLPMITDAMLRRGYSEERIRKFLGGNLLRVFRQVTEKRTARDALAGGR
ncbi:MAG TPA: dipeptidase [Bryobacteraceae bacterium]|nr:dipeptidase [Bryobacteraceae bacterium]